MADAPVSWLSYATSCDPPPAPFFDKGPLAGDPKRLRGNVRLALIVLCLVLLTGLASLSHPTVSLRGAPAPIRTTALSPVAAMQAQQVEVRRCLPRRDFVTGFLAALSALSLPQAVGAEETVLVGKPYTSKLFRCELPPGWTLGYDRGGGLRGTGTVATFTAAEVGATFSVRRIDLATFTAGIADLDGDGLFRALENEAAATPGVVGIETKRLDLGATSTTGYTTAEYILRTCLGNIEGGGRGAVRCLEEFSRVIPMIVRHYYAVAAVRGSDVYLGLASAPVDHWPEASAGIYALVNSLRVTTEAQP